METQLDLGKIIRMNTNASDLGTWTMEDDTRGKIKALNREIRKWAKVKVQWNFITEIKWDGFAFEEIQPDNGKIGIGN